MPTYEYLCQTCRHRFETWQKMTDDPLTTCPECGNSIRRVLYPAGVVFKGHGFYKTDHGQSSLASTNTNEDKKSENNGTGEKKAESTADSPAASDNKPSEKATSSSTSAAAAD
ncbi:MAG TPA: FmdB family zinc ribbon protein [Ktedonobacteraceae bacterium]|nr:FmdB family zinc ribbon protein [Ktedonobacteraceae bacterium]